MARPLQWSDSTKMRSVRPGHLQPLPGGQTLDHHRDERQEALFPPLPGSPTALVRRLRRASGMAAVLAALARSAAGTAKGDVAVALAFDPQVGAWRCAVAGPVSAGDGWIAHLEGAHPIRPDVIRLARRAGLSPLGVPMKPPRRAGP